MARQTPRKRRPRAPQAHPTGPLDTVDETWKDAVRAAMTREGWTQQDLAEKIPASKGAISNMFKPGDRQTRFKRRIEELCGMENNGVLEAVLRRVEVHWSRLSPTNAEIVAKLVESLAAKIEADD